jgi:transcriptional regulator with XRE-family HTH domain
MAGGRQGAAGFDPGRLRAARLAANLTQTALAAVADVHPNEVGYWEAGTRVPQVETVAALARALGISPADLLEPSTGGRPTLRQLRVAAGLSQEQAADRAGLQRHRYAALERGEAARLTDPEVSALAQALAAGSDQIRAAHAAGRAGSLRTRTRRSRTGLGED